MLKGDNLNRIGPYPHACQGIIFASPTSTIVLQMEKHHVPSGWVTNGYNVISSTLSQTITHGIIVVCAHGPFIPQHLNLPNQKLKCDM